MLDLIHSIIGVSRCILCICFAAHVCVFMGFVGAFTSRNENAETNSLVLNSILFELYSNASIYNIYVFVLRQSRKHAFLCGKAVCTEAVVAIR